MQKKLLGVFLLLFSWSIYGEAQGQETIRLQGKVYDEERRPVAGASISIDGYPLSTDTDSFGSFTLSPLNDLVDGRVRIRITREGMKVWAQNIDIRRDMSPIIIILSQAIFIIEGEVVDRGGEPIGGATITVEAREQGMIMEQTRTDDRGRYFLQFFSPDSEMFVMLKVKRDGFIPWKELIRIDRGRLSIESRIIRVLPPELNSPSNRSRIEDPTPLFDWEDVDWREDVDDLTYHLQIATDPNFRTITINEPELRISEYTVGRNLSKGIYYWKVKAKYRKNDESGESEWCEKWVVKIGPKWGIGIAAGPSISLKYNFAPKYSLEMKGAYSWDDPEIIVIGGRLYYNFTQLSGGILYAGGEMNYTKFSYQSPVREMNKGMNPEDISGDGYTISLFIGGEHFLGENDKFSLILDIGPIYTNINDEYGDSIKEWNWVVNIGVLFYP